MKRLTNKVVLIVGETYGISKATIKCFGRGS